MIRNKHLVYKTAGYKALMLGVYAALFGGRIGIAASLISTVLYFLYDYMYSRIFKVSQAHAGAVVWMTGLPCSGKTTIAQLTATSLRSKGYSVEVLDGDVLRDGLCEDLGFSLADREENLRRVSHTAALLKRSGVIVISALISPYEEHRIRAREICGDGFIETYIATQSLVCAERDVKGMWALAKEGKIKNFTGYDDPFEVPKKADMYIHTEWQTPEESAALLEEEILRRGGF